MPPKRKDKETTDDNDELVSLKMVKVLMSQQESAFKSLLDSLIKSTIARVDGLVKEVADLKASLEYSQKDIAESGKSIKQNEKTIAAITVELTSTKTTLDKCHNKATYLENQSRRNNIRVIGIQKNPTKRGKNQRL
ncbi:Hypothetical predicted protein [Paramuricea clavata]|uniref:Uncharacterized protein n=1 Tax=Paramuricea clavata TaxID=317549 RepID=A0A7D9IWZ9_PARCT|nr:Hypothetical predicted protein [Paramuricea clavata]